MRETQRNGRDSRLRLAGAVLAAGLLGCGSGHELQTAPVEGRVTLDGAPLTSGYVMALPVKGRMARGAIQEDGSFVLGSYSASDGAQVGEHPVIVTPVPADEGGSRPRSSQQIPRRYQRAASSGITVNVQPQGVRDWKIELTSQE